jgi:hypothetical protein
MKYPTKEEALWIADLWAKHARKRKGQITVGALMELAEKETPKHKEYTPFVWGVITQYMAETLLSVQLQKSGNNPLTDGGIA